MPTKWGPGGICPNGDDIYRYCSFYDSGDCTADEYRCTIDPGFTELNVEIEDGKTYEAAVVRLAYWEGFGHGKEKHDADDNRKD